MKTLTPSLLIKVCKDKGFKINELPNEINIIAIRTADNSANTFNDIVGLLYLDNKEGWNWKQYPCTTDAGTYYRENPINVDGTAIIVPGQYIGTYKVGRHKDYEAMEQVGKLKYIRDNNRNKILDWIYDKVGTVFQWEVAKTNIHHAGVNSVQVDKWSAGCIVIASLANFIEFLSIIRRSINTYGKPNLFNFTLLEEKDFN